MSVSQLARSEKLPPQNPLHGLPHDLKHLAYPQPLRDLRPLRSRRSIKTSFLLSRLLFSRWNRLHSLLLPSIQTLAPFPRKLLLTLRLCGLSLRNPNKPCYPQHLLVYLLLLVCWRPPGFLLRYGHKRSTLHSRKFLTRCRHKHRP